MMYANNPYQKVDNGVGSGLIGGALVGAGAAAGMQFGAVRGLRGIRGVTGNALRGAMAGGGSTKGYEMAHKTAVNGSRYAKGINRLAFKGGGVRTAAVYAGASVLGGLLGMGVDAMNG